MPLMKFPIIIHMSNITTPFFFLSTFSSSTCITLFLYKRIDKNYKIKATAKKNQKQY